jgi:TatD DNase family protein
MLIDSHAHLNFQEFENDWQEIVADCLANNIWVINIGSQMSTSKKGIEIANSQAEGIYSAVGLHPIHVLGSSFHPEDFKIEEYQSLIDSSDKVVALGETGIDFFHDDNNFSQQVEVFQNHLILAEKNNLPVVIHGRNSKDGSKNAYQEILKILGNKPKVSGVAHCFGGTLEEAQMFIEKGFKIGFTGIITFDKTGLVESIAKNLSLEDILIETDCPFLAPKPYRGKRNQPQYVQHVAEKIAEVRGVSYEEIASQTVSNIKKLFNLP